MYIAAHSESFYVGAPAYYNKIINIVLAVLCSTVWVMYWHAPLLFPLLLTAVLFWRLGFRLCLPNHPFFLSKAQTKTDNPVTAKISEKKRIKVDGNMKLVLIVRNDLNMGKGKIAAQCAHAAVSAYRQAVEDESPYLDAWEDSGQAKITLKVEKDDDLQHYKYMAEKQGLPTNIVMDAGRTQIAAGSRTVLSVGPAPASLVDEVCGKLKLL
ncbi:putative peptidyl-tRna hydrolase [Cardiosporidium cionae]|uniref:peptidyl-tRNA hydrolase n=1 Tax=Cardiosporidium cionae TaxID=476202 RepID=A0ABQ7JCQ1_9APIC|nr:putative peptidyl-tRna hydrolase [Cardiosporidium cionae]|eukprot:KAF8821811.1 putative peptidyl-tRna hydrolase [Cardiosporidium cionae]